MTNTCALDRFTAKHTDHAHDTTWRRKCTPHGTIQRYSMKTGSIHAIKSARQGTTVCIASITEVSRSKKQQTPTRKTGKQEG